MMRPNGGQIITGPAAPTRGTLVEWLKTHPEYHVMTPESTSARKTPKQTSNTSFAVKIHLNQL